MPENRQGCVDHRVLNCCLSGDAQVLFDFLTSQKGGQRMGQPRPFWGQGLISCFHGFRSMMKLPG
jgi:hypothetical protein